MRAGIAKVDITPDYSIWMEGMPRGHKSEGVHDKLFARALVLANTDDLSDAYAVASIDVCAVSEEITSDVVDAVSKSTGILPDHIVLTSTHTHSGAAVIGMYNPMDERYVQEFTAKLIEAIELAVKNIRPASVGIGCGREARISHYRRLLADDGSVVMNWEEFPDKKIIGPLGIIDPELLVMRVDSSDTPAAHMALMFNHAGHPNVLSGDSYVLSADYPGVTHSVLEKEFGGMPMYINGALGTMDIDGLHEREWSDAERLGDFLADSVAQIAREITPSSDLKVSGDSVKYSIPSRKISEDEYSWAQKILAEVGENIHAQRDGIGDDYLARLFTQLREVENRGVPVEQICFAIGDVGFISFPGELFTEIGMQIKARSPFRHTFILGVANGFVRYIPTRVAIAQGGYAEITRIIDDCAEDVVKEQSIALLNKVYNQR